jgi:hypothetical protein
MTDLVPLPDLIILVLPTILGDSRRSAAVREDSCGLLRVRQANWRWGWRAPVVFAAARSPHVVVDLCGAPHGTAVADVRLKRLIK